jgi:hypothetical protein
MSALSIIVALVIFTGLFMLSYRLGSNQGYETGVNHGRLLQEKKQRGESEQTLDNAYRKGFDDGKEEANREIREKLVTGLESMLDGLKGRQLEPPVHDLYEVEE